MTSRLIQVDLDEKGIAPPSSVIEQERRVAIFDLLEENSFDLVAGIAGPYRLTLGRKGGKLRFVISPAESDETIEFSMPQGPLRQVVKDYDQICSSYYEAVRSQGPSEIEVLDKARRAIHHEGGRMVQDGLIDRVKMDTDTARRLFTLICALMPLDQ